MQRTKAFVNTANNEFNCGAGWIISSYLVSELRNTSVKYEWNVTGLAALEIYDTFISSFHARAGVWARSRAICPTQAPSFFIWLNTVSLSKAFPQREASFKSPILPLDKPITYKTYRALITFLASHVGPQKKPSLDLSLRRLLSVTYWPTWVLESPSLDELKIQFGFAPTAVLWLLNVNIQKVAHTQHVFVITPTKMYYFAYFIHNLTWHINTEYILENAVSVQALSNRGY